MIEENSLCKLLYIKYPIIQTGIRVEDIQLLN